MASQHVKNKDKTISPVDGRTIYQDDRIIDWAKSDTCRRQRTWPQVRNTSLYTFKLKKQSNGKSIYNLLHPYVKPGYQSFRRNPNLNASYDNFRKEHWKKRAESYLKSQGKCAEEECG